ncbi:MAG: B12-binding domain-containing radical SAM protein [Thermoflexales bacterium]|nr:B12-binding domain-containing radical SAM protein [Thermoflexales bacterium]
MKVMLVFPPPWTPAMPHLALPVLASFLRSHGVQVIQRDLNLETYDAVLSRAYLEQVADRLSQVAQAREMPESVRWALTQGPGLAARVEAAKAVYRGPDFYDGAKSLQAFEIIVQSLELASLPFHPARLDLLNHVPASPVDSSRSLLQAVRDSRHNLFLDLFRHIILPDIQRERPDIVGISIPTMGQMLAAMTLAYLIKQAGLLCHVTLGGPHISMLRDQLPHAPALFGLIDSAVMFDGETPLLRLAEAIDGGGDLVQVPNLIYRAGGEIQANPTGIRKNPIKPQAWHKTARKAPPPDFDGLPLDRYLAPDLVLPLITAHGCYHGQCAFCNVGYGAGRGFYPLPVEQVLEHITSLREKHGARHIFFADEAIPPRTLRALSTELARQGAPVDWCGCARFDRALSQELLESMAGGGYRMALFGLETASERVIQHMIKGTQRETMGRVLEESARAGIWNHTFFFFGFPTETMDDAQETINFIYAHQTAIHSASPGVFILERYSPVHLNPEKFGVRHIVQRPDQDLAIYFDYHVESGLDDEMAETIVERLLDVWPSKRYGQYYVHDVYRFLYASHLHAQGQPFPPWLMEEGGTS